MPLIALFRRNYIVAKSFLVDMIIMCRFGEYDD
jgi:hypothetical protein